MRTNKGTFKKGNPGKPKGAKNKTTEEIRERFQILLDNNLDKIQKDLDSLEPEERLKIIFTLSKFVLPTLKSTALDVTSNNEPYWFDSIGNKTDEEIEIYLNEQYEN